MFWYALGSSIVTFCLTLQLSFFPRILSPHRMGLQYFEALSPGTIASIVAVLVNRMITGNDVTGMFSYPFL